MKTLNRTPEFPKWYKWPLFTSWTSWRAKKVLASGVTMGPSGPQRRGPRQKGPKRGPFSNHIGVWELGAHFWDPAGAEIQSYVTRPYPKMRFPSPAPGDRSPPVATPLGWIHDIDLSSESILTFPMLEISQTGYDLNWFEGSSRPEELSNAIKLFPAVVREIV